MSIPEMDKKSQYSVILSVLESGQEISQLEATKKYGILRLGAIIFNLRKNGYNILTRKVSKPNRYGNISNYAVYKLIQKGE